MSQFGVISGACDATDSDIVLGEILVTNLPRNGTVEVVLTGSSNVSLSYVPVAELTGGKGGAVLLYDNQPSKREYKRKWRRFYDNNIRFINSSNRTIVIGCVYCRLHTSSKPTLSCVAAM